MKNEIKITEWKKKHIMKISFIFIYDKCFFAIVEFFFNVSCFYKWIVVY